VTAASDHGDAEHARSRRRTVGVVAVVGILLMVLPWLAGRLVAGATVLDGLGIAGPRPFAPEVERHPATLAAADDPLIPYGELARSTQSLPTS
jgi:hypothetical protein